MSARRLIGVGVSVEGAPFAVVSCNVEIPTLAGVGAAACSAERVRMVLDIRLFEAWLRWLAKSDPNYAMWLADGAPSVYDGAFSGDFCDVDPAECREGYIGE